jgi:hypothetical protein
MEGMVSFLGVNIPNPVKMVEGVPHLLSSGANDLGNLANDGANLFATAMKDAAAAVPVVAGVAGGVVGAVIGGVGGGLAGGVGGTLVAPGVGTVGGAGWRRSFSGQGGGLHA